MSRRLLDILYRFVVFAWLGLLNEGLTAREWIIIRITSDNMPLFRLCIFSILFFYSIQSGFIPIHLYNSVTDSSESIGWMKNGNTKSKSLCGFRPNPGP